MGEELQGEELHIPGFIDRDKGTPLTSLLAQVFPGVHPNIDGPLHKHIRSQSW
jgi:hypothetical protein